ncbi:hypothetical protein [Flavobacterium macacae]|uniref:Uncharacterized protein n=1 Tax=Flavobacterium macacae TaxID=2488993 RepID=A0A3P3W6J8_9FLAO|nr:hypothetical protein [Flavobacterium macacae]RRJ90028.1 hypothetical protein EG849_11945 [Flavobacterium macacae]
MIIQKRSLYPSTFNSNWRLTTAKHTVFTLPFLDFFNALFLHQCRRIEHLDQMDIGRHKVGVGISSVRVKGNLNDLTQEKFKLLQRPFPECVLEHQERIVVLFFGQGRKREYSLRAGGILHFPFFAFPFQAVADFEKRADGRIKDKDINRC